MQRAENKTIQSAWELNLEKSMKLIVEAVSNSLRNQFKRSNTDLCKMKQMYSLYVFKTRALK